MRTRIVLGLMMIAIMAGLLFADWRLTLDRFDTAASLWQASPGAPIELRALPLTALFAVLLVIAFKEMKSLSAAVGVKVLTVSGFAGTLVLSTLPFWWQLVPQYATASNAAFFLSAAPGEWRVLLLAGLIVMMVFAEQMMARTSDDALRRIACTLLTVMYLGVGGALTLAIRIQFNLPVLVMFLLAVKFTDIGAYFTGSAIGRHKLIPWLSPGKSWEGLIGGLVVAAGATALAAWAMDVHLSAAPLALPKAAVFGAAVGLAGQFGDLCESLLKRATGVKDSGRFLPEFGGILDILDSPLLSSPIAYLLLVWMAS